LGSFGAGLFSIIIIDLLLSGDNALVIGMAVRGLPSAQKRRAIVIGGAGALLLRVVLTALAALLLQIPFLEVGGGLVLAWITYRLLLPGGDAGGARDPNQVLSFGAALRTIMIADLTMSLDNVLAVGAAANGDLALLLVGLALSMGIIMAGGSLVSVLLERMSWLIYVGAAVLLIVAGDLMADDPLVIAVLGAHTWSAWALSAILGLGVGAALLAHTLRRRRAPDAAQASEPSGVKSDILQV
jgi:YjbE family integral membrane protein